MDLAEMLQDPEVMYAYEHTFSDADVWDWLNRQRERYQRDGFGLWAVIKKGVQSGLPEMIGQAGLTMQPCEGRQVLEVGYLLKKRFWHQGYAVEAAKACMQYAFQCRNADRVHSIIKADNWPSIRVADALGMEKEKEFMAEYYHGKMLHVLYSMERPSQDVHRNK